MRFHGLMVLRDEGDIIRESLSHLLTWIDAVYLLDLGSTDNTWEIVQEFAARDSRVVPLRRQPTVFNDALRSVLFDAFRDRFEPGDWILKVDADEFYHVPPPIFVKERMRRGETAALLQWYFFRLTDTEVADYDSGKVNILADRQRPIGDRRRYYKKAIHGEPRMFRYRKSMRWSEDYNCPINMGYVARERLPILHYPHRDPLQMERRFKLRATMSQLKGSQMGGHWMLEDWRKEIVDSSGVAASTAMGESVGLSAFKTLDYGPLMYWEPGTPLPETRLYNHVTMGPKRMLQRIIHPLLLPILDSTRQHYKKSFSPTVISEEMNEGIYQGRQSPASTADLSRT